MGSTVDKILRTVITSIFVGICGCPIRIQLIALHKYGLQEDMLISCIFIAIFKHRTVKSHGRFFNFLLFLTCFCSRSGIQFRTYLLSVERLKDVVWAQPFCSPGNISPFLFFKRYRRLAFAIEMMPKSTSTRFRYNFISEKKRKRKYCLIAASFCMTWKFCLKLKKIL